MTTTALGIDVGFTNLGLAVVDMGPDAPVSVAWSQNVYVGDSGHPQHFSKTLVPYLNNIYAEYQFTCIGAETPPFIVGQIKTTALLHRVFGNIECWAHERGLPVRYVAPMAIKRRAQRLVGETDKKRTEKALIREAVERLVGGKARRTNHENDAAFAAWACWAGAEPEPVV